MVIDEQATSPRVGFIEFMRPAFEQSLVDRFEEQVDRYPNRLAPLWTPAAGASSRGAVSRAVRLITSSAQMS
jgi:hypothetical protein